MNTYTTISGAQVKLNDIVWKGIKRLALKRFNGSLELFESCWRQYRKNLNGGIDDPKSISDVTDWLEQIASEKVNDPKSRFYIHG